MTGGGGRAGWGGGDGAWVLYSARYPRRSAGMTELVCAGGAGRRPYGLRLLCAYWLLSQRTVPVVTAKSMEPEFRRPAVSP